MSDKMASSTCDVMANGPYDVRGRLALKQGETISAQTHMRLCRCGASRNKPFCDDSHIAAGFRSDGVLRVAKPAPMGADLDAIVTVTPQVDGPLQLRGPMTLRDPAGVTAFVDSDYLCRCGASQNKPYCDGMHRKIGFTA